MMKCAVFILFLCVSQTALSAGGAKPKEPKEQNSFQDKRVIAISDLASVEIELPDGALKNFGEDYHTRLETSLIQDGRYILYRPVPEIESVSAQSRSLITTENYEWTGSALPAANLKITIQEFSFVTGARGNRMFYGFNPMNPNLYKNEFPLKPSAGEPSWFDKSFEGRGDDLTGSRSGLDLGSGISIDFLFAWLNLKYEKYRSAISVLLEVENPWNGRRESKKVNVKGKGFFFDLSAGYEQFSVGIQIARKDAFLKAMNKAVTESTRQLVSMLPAIPMVARIDHILESDDLYLLGTGMNARVSKGTRYQSLDAQDLILEVIENSTSGAIAKRVSGEKNKYKTGMVFSTELKTQIPLVLSLESRSLAMHRAPASYSKQKETLKEVELGWEDLPKPSFPEGTIVEIPRLEAIAKSIAGLFTLPYRIWRYKQYDQTYHEKPDEKGTPQKWHQSILAKEWAKDLKLQKANSVAKVPVLVAVLDTGVDYNHPAIHDAIDVGGPEEARYGYDFISGDHRAYDDHFHGTEIASLILAVDPSVKILPVKIFNPWGVTSSSSLYSGFQFAIERGAKVIVCAWNTRKYSKAMEDAVKLADRHGVWVVTAAGDLGVDIGKYPTYPAAFKSQVSHLLVSTASDGKGNLLKKKNRWVSGNSELVDFAVSVEEIKVANPRKDKSKVPSSDHSAAILAGVMARVLGDGMLNSDELGIYLKDQAKKLQSLHWAVSQGLELNF